MTLGQLMTSDGWEPTSLKARPRLEQTRLEQRFFKQMGERLADATSRLRHANETCKALSQASSARGIAEKVSHQLTQVDIAKGLPTFTQSLVGRAGKPEVEPSQKIIVGAPAFLNHLHAPVPNQNSNPASPGAQSLQVRNQVLDVQTLINASITSLNVWSGDTSRIEAHHETLRPKQRPEFIESDDTLPNTQASHDTLLLKHQAESTTSADPLPDMHAKNEIQRPKHQTESSTEEFDDPTFAGLNKYFALAIETQREFEIAFPIIVLLMIDVIYPRKVRWSMVDWNASYLNALTKNYALLSDTWDEIKMYRVGDFRNFFIENMITSSCMEKLHFLQSLRRWFDLGAKQSAKYNPFARRAEILAQYKHTGRCARFPAWVQQNDPDEAIQTASSPRIPEPKLVIADVDTMQSHGAMAKSVMMPSDNRFLSHFRHASHEGQRNYIRVFMAHADS